MITKMLCFLVFIVFASGQPNYQERSIYYSESDNVCRFGESSDHVNLIINIDDKDRMKRTVRGETGCSQWSFRCADAISPSTMMYLLDDDNQVNFKQEATRKYRFGLLSDLIQKVTMQNPATINGKSYNCTIFGDGTVQHFGTDFSTDPAEIYLRCLSISKPSKNLLIQGQI